MRSLVALAIIAASLVLAVSPAIAGWTEPLCLSELGATANQVSISADQRVILFLRDDILIEAHRDDPDGPFTEERVVTELGDSGHSVPTTWLSADGLRLYFSEIMYLQGKWQRVIRMASRPSTHDTWQLVRTHLEIHVNGEYDDAPSLTSDELTMVWLSKPASGSTWSVFMASRPSHGDLFSTPVKVAELNTLGALNPHLSGDGLRVYFNMPRPDNGRNNLYMMSRPSLAAKFDNLRHLDGVTGPDDGGSSPFLTPDEETIYFHGGRGDPMVAGIWVSHLRCAYDLLGDLNDDCTVNLADLALVASNWLVDCKADPEDPACVHE